MKKKIIIIAIAVVIVIAACILKGVLASNNKSENETDTTRVIVEPITSEVPTTSVGETISDLSTIETTTAANGIVIETLPEETASEIETTTQSSIIINYSVPDDPDPTKKKEKTTRKEKETKKEKVTKENTTTKKDKEIPTYPKETTKKESTTKKEVVTKKIGSYTETNILSSSKISIVRNSILSSINGSQNSEFMSLAKYMSAHKLSNASSTYSNLTGQKLSLKSKTCSISIESDSNDNIMSAAQKAASKIGSISGKYGIGISSFKGKSGYSLYIVVIYK